MMETNNSAEEARYYRDKHVIETSKVNHLKGINEEGEPFNNLSVVGVSEENFARYLKENNIQLTEYDKKIKEMNRRVRNPYPSPPNPIKIMTRRENQAHEFIKYQPLFYDKMGLWWVWDREKKYYKIVDEIDILNFFRDRNDEDIISSKIRSEIINALKQVGRREMPTTESNKLIQFKNGIIHLDEGNTLLEPNPAYFITNPLPYNLGDKEDTPVMDSIFEQWVGKTWVKTLYQIIAYCMLPDFPIHRLFCFHGEGRNGKSSFLNLLQKFIGEENCTSTSLTALVESKFETCKLHKKLVATMGETNMNELHDTEVIKKITGGDNISIEYKGKNPHSERVYTKLLINTNHLPSTADKAIGFYSRWIIVDFPNRFNEKEDVLAKIPDIEYENLGRKCINLLKELLEKREFSNEGTAEEKRQRYEERSNPFDQFFKQFIEPDPTGYIGKSIFRERCKNWMIENKQRVLSDVTIEKKMRTFGVETIRILVKDGNGNQIQPRVWGGIKWKNA